MLLAYGAVIVPEPNIVALLTSGLLCVSGPFILFLLLRRKLSLKFIPFICGAILYMVFVLLIENPFLYLISGIDSPFYDAMIANPALYMLFAGFSAGFIEEGGRYLTFHVLKKWYPDYQVSVSTALGFFSIDSIYLVGVRFIIYALLAINHNFRVQAGGTSLGLQSILLTLSQASPSEYLLSGLERILYGGIHIGLSSLVWYSIAKPGRTYLLYGSVILHAIFMAPAALREVHVLNSMSLYLIVLSMFSLICLVIAFLVRRADIRSRSKLSDPFSLF